VTIAEFEVETARHLRSEIDGLNANLGENTGGIAHDRRTQRRVAGETLVDHVLYSDRRDGAFDIDVVVVDGSREVRQEARTQNHAKTDGVGNFRLQIRIAARHDELRVGHVAPEGIRG